MPGLTDDDVLGSTAVPPAVAAPTPTAPAATPAPNLTLPALGTGPGYVSQDDINTAAKSAGIDPDLYTRVIRRESAGRIGALSSAGAIGPAQLMPPTAADLGVNPHDPIQNLHGGAQYLRQMLDRYGGDEEKGLAAYNAGPDVVDKAGGVPNIPETKAYVAAIRGGAGAAPKAGGYDIDSEFGGGAASQTTSAMPPGTVHIEWDYGKNAYVDSATKKIAYSRAPGTDLFTDPTGNQFHVVGVPPPVSAAQVAATGFGQGIGPDTVASATRLTGGGLAVGDPMLAAYAQSQGGPSAFETAEAAKQSAAQQQAQYAAGIGKSPLAQGFRFGGQLVPAGIASAFVPEISALRGVPFFGGLAMNALRGAAAQLPSVGASLQSIPEQLGMAAAGGAITSHALQALGGLGSILRRAGMDPSKIAPETLDLANKAIGNFGIKLQGAQIAGLAGRDAAIRTPQDVIQQQAQWTQAALKEIGASPGFNGFTKKAMSSALANNQQMFRDFASRNSITNTDGLLTQLGNVVKKAQDVLPEGEAAPLLKQLQAIASTIQDEGHISGQSFLALTNTDSKLAALSRMNNNASGFASEMKQTIEQAMRAEASPADQALFDQARAQWKAMKTIEPLAEKGGPAGIVQPQAVLQRVVSNPFNDDYAYVGAGRFGDLAEIGNTFLKPPSAPKPAPKGGMFQTALGAAGGVGLGEAALQLVPKAIEHGPVAAMTGGAALAGLGTLWAAHKGVEAAQNALERFRFGPEAGSALAGVARPPGTTTSLAAGAKKVLVPLSALAGVRTAPGRIPVGANAQ